MSASTSPISLPTAPSAPPARTALLMGLAVLLVAFWPTWSSFVAAWLEQREQGFLVAGFCLWYAWRHRDTLLQPGDGLGVAAIPLAFLSLMWLVGIVLSARLVHQAAVPPLLLGWILAVAGVPAAMAALPVVGAFFLVVPFWGVLGPPLQALTVIANGIMLSVLNIEAKIEGTYIAIPSGVFEVAAGCSGVKYLESGVIIAAVYGLLFLRTWRARAVAAALAAVLSMVSNWVRVVGLIIVGHRTQMQSPLIADHDTYGWIIFAATLSVFFVLVRRIEAYDDRLTAGAEQAPRPVPAVVQRSMGEQVRAAALPTLAAVVGPLLLLGASARSVTTTAPDSLASITPAAEWVRDGAPVITASPVPVEPDSTTRASEFMPLYFGADELRRQQWRADSSVVQVDRLVYFTQAQGKELINTLNEIARDPDVLGGGLIGPIGERNRMITGTVVRVGAQPHLVWSWFRVAGVDTHSRTEAKLLELVEFASPGHAAELVAVSTPCAATDCTAATGRLFRFVTGQSMPQSGSPPPPRGAPQP
jgi:exosortase